MFRRIFLYLVACAFAALCPQISVVRADIVIDNYSDSTNDRFSNDSALIASQFDLSGIGQDAGGLWSTAIGRNVVITAFHGRSNGPIYFYPGNDPNLSPVVREIVSGVKVGSTDLYLAVLNENLPSSIASYSFATEPLVGTPPVPPPPNPPPPMSVDDAGIYQGLNAYMFGRSPAGHLASQDQAVGRNIVTGYSENVRFLDANNDSLIFANDAPGSANYTMFETMLMGGDSGAPAFVEIGGEFRLIGTNAFIYEPDDFVIGGFGSGINYTGNQAVFIHSFIALNAVPEPSSLALITTMICLSVFHRNKRSSRNLGIYQPT